MTTRLLTTILAVLATIALAGAACAYSGTLSSADGGILGSGIWMPAPTVLNWSVTENVDGSWHYSYTLDVGDRGAISHFILETSPNFTKDLILNSNWSSGITYVGTWEPGGSNPSMPSSIYGIKFDSTTSTVQTFYFDSFRTPVWGDFYAKDGVAGGTINTAWNAGFDSAPPTITPDQDLYNTKILVPDTEPSVPNPAVPEASSFVLASMGLLPVLGLKLRRGK